MAVADGVDLRLFHQREEMVELEDEPAARSESRRVRLDRRAQIGFVCQRVDIHHEISTLVRSTRDESGLDELVQPGAAVMAVEFDDGVSRHQTF